MTSSSIDADLVPANGSLLQLIGVNKWYGEHWVLKSVDLDISPGEVVVVIGPSGCGKSTMLRTANMLEVPTSGSVHFNGKDITDPRTNLNSIRRQIGIVFQAYNLFPHKTASGNIRLALERVLNIGRREAKERALESLNKVGLSKKAECYPSQLSGGQQQRLAIARALALDPKLMLFDEVTSALDPELVREVLETMKKLAVEGMTMIVVTHEMTFAREVADRVVFMHDGEIVETGTPDRLLKKPEDPRCEDFLSHVL